MLSRRLRPALALLGAGLVAVLAVMTLVSDGMSHSVCPAASAASSMEGSVQDLVVG